ncbi:MAG: MATE family efflux transporter [Lachnospiraceae bacterium]|nr:MATE family efflux transporter [Lachnospiraceae bacterium]
MLVQALYNVVDSIFVAQISENALTAVTLAFPMQNLMIAVGSGTGVGINALLSRSLGEKRFRRADEAANTGLFLTFLSFVTFLLIGLFGAKAFVRTQTDVEEIIVYGSTYLRIVSCLSVGLFFQMTFERLLQSTGRTVQSMISQGTGAIINIIFDPIMIFGLFGFPRLGVAGAAYATVLGQFVAAVLGLFMNLRINRDIHISMQDILHPSREIIGMIYYVGVPSILMMSIGSIMTYAMNRILITFSTTAAAVFGVYFKLQSFFFMPVFGLNNGLIPVLAYNYGARRRDRIEEALKFAMCLAVGIMLVGVAVFELFPGTLLDLFNASDQMKEIGIPALRIICTCFPVAAVCIVMGSTFQAFSQSINSLIVSVGRQLVVLIPAAWLLAQTGVLRNVWFAFPIAEVMSLALSIVLFRRLHAKMILPLSEDVL